MIHHSTAVAGDHYAASVYLNDQPHPSGVLAQLQGGSEAGFPIPEQVRIKLTPQEARHFAKLLLDSADRVEAHLAAQD